MLLQTHVETTYPTSCKDIKTRLPASLSGLYDIAIDTSTLITVYCEMAKDGGGFTFIPRNAVENGKRGRLIEQLFTDKTRVLLRIQKKDGLQPFTLIRQLPARASHSLEVKMHDHTGYARPQNYNLGDYLYLGILSNTVANRRDEQGFRANNDEIKFNNCDGNPNSYFAFFPNHREQAISNYHGGNLVYERQGVAWDWRQKGVPSYGHRLMPNEFFFLTELPFGGCGCYTSSDRWTDAHGTAIGVR